ncbi:MULTISPECIES: replicative DNA helicase [unclassified Marinobacterium]|uniref:replicative DNA helicase n=1 Tax=unclassified Marinobacterium TaxID=2644139 RepID=UPI0015697317|nr:MULTISPECIES: replicative DNA helicase [unclassified Marinobacterium]NRP10168.1 Replicative DNA helicase [Marinobacterium sp. xm-g-48]NRP27767.1 Replicative DNA helicase [Marinobacterium sp. xm-d-420]NRP38346.1 Replicative DNA helicase [Marinobacterium sp. xm-a-121]NRP53267.1 Replicative DNA helicase [Marinobacterium sp. xm-v-242]NRP57382.1 Replicative DNA helicase [Marinobacterium sp. xm-d-510]
MLDFQDDDLTQAKVPPHSIEAEQSVLGGLMLDNNAWDVVSEVCLEQHFYTGGHRMMFRTMQKLIDQGRPIDVVTLSEELDRTGELERAGGLEYLVDLARNTPSTSNIRAYSEIVRDRALLRQMISVSTEISDSSFFPDGRSADEVLNEAESKIFQIAENRPNQSGPQSVNPLLKAAVERIDELFSNGDALTGLTTGFDDLNERTGGLQPSDLIIVAARPSMGKCIVSGSRLVDPKTGSRLTIDEMVAEQYGSVTAVNDQFKLVEARASQFVDDGVKPVFEVKTALGRSIKTTLTHPFLTGKGWKKLADISTGEKIGVPRVLPIFGSTPLPEYQVKALAYFLSDGGTTQTNPIFTNVNKTIVADFKQAVEQFNSVKVTRTSYDHRAPSYRVSGRSENTNLMRVRFAAYLENAMQRFGLSGKSLANRLSLQPSTISAWRNAVSVPNPLGYQSLCDFFGSEFQQETHEVYESSSTLINPVTVFLKEQGVWGCLAHEKVIPEAVFSLPKSHLKLFLNRIFACDGGVSFSSTGQIRISYSSASESLASDIQHLLLRFGIVAKLRTKTHHKRDQFEVELISRESIETFITQIGMIGKEDRLAKAKAELSLKRSHTNRDALPDSVNDYILELKGEQSWPDLFAQKGLECPNGFNPHLQGVSKRSLSRQKARFYAELFDDSYLMSLSSSDLYWDEIVSIDYVGNDQVYDLTVPELHNFVAEDICVHNTTFAMNLVENALMGDDKPVLVFSLEMPAAQLMTRMLSSLGRINQTRVRNGQLEDDDWPKLTAAVNMLKNKPLYIDDQPGISPNEMRTRARRIVREHGEIGMIMVDYLQLMQIKTGKSEGRTAEISEISRSLKALAKEMNCPVVALSQLNRSLEQRPNKRPVNSDLRESGAIEQDADVIMFIYRDEVYNEDSPEKGVAEIIIGKQRNGPIGTTRLAFIGKYTRFENLAHSYEYPPDE